MPQIIYPHPTGVVGASLFFHFLGGREYAPGQCNNEPSNLFAGFLIYGSYLYLFVEFFMKKTRSSSKSSSNTSVEETVVQKEKEL
jgi:hypothetical protein